MDSRDLGMLWSMRDSIQLQPKKVGRGLGLFKPTSLQLQLQVLLAWPTPCPLLAYINWFGPYTRFTLFFLCASYHSYLSFIFRRFRPICTSIIMLRFMYIHAFFLGQLVRTTYFRTSIALVVASTCSIP